MQKIVQIFSDVLQSAIGKGVMVRGAQSPYGGIRQNDRNVACIGGLRFRELQNGFVLIRRSLLLQRLLQIPSTAPRVKVARTSGAVNSEREPATTRSFVPIRTFLWVTAAKSGVRFEFISG